MNSILDIFLHLDAHLGQWIEVLGPWIYGVTFVIIFCETGLVIAPLLPGDSLLFALGALSVGESAKLSLPVLLGLLGVAAVLGDSLNYWVGRLAGEYMINHPPWKSLIRPEHLQKTEAFYARHGGKALVLGRFLPILRTFVPFAAGMGRMNYGPFMVYNVAGGIVWTGAFLGLGHIFGNLPSVKSNFHYVIVAIVAISLAPMIYAYVAERFCKRAAT